MQFSNTSGLSTPTDLIPSGFLCWVMVTFRGMKASQSGGSYADLELTIADKQPLARKKLWTKIGDPDHPNNSEGYRNMGMASLTRMVEAAGVVNSDEPASYEKLNGRTCEQIMMLLDGKYVAIRVKVEPGKDGYQDKNDVGDFLSPNKNGSSYKNFTKLTAGDHGVAITASPARPGSGSGGGFGAAPVVAPPPQLGFQGQPLGQSERPLDPSPSPLTTTSPSSGGFNPNSAPAFLAAHQR